MRCGQLPVCAWVFTKLCPSASELLVNNSGGFNGYKGANMRKLSKGRIKLHVQTDMLPWRNPPKVSRMRAMASADHSQTNAKRIFAVPAI